MARKNYIDIQDSLEILKNSAHSARELNEYCIRITHRETQGVFCDWFHTRGSLCVNHDGKTRRVYGWFDDIESAAKALDEEIKKLS